MGKARRPSTRLLRRAMCFVFIADNSRMLEDRKEQPLILCSEQGVLLCRAWSACTQGESGQVAGGAVHAHACVHALVSGCVTDVHSIVTKL